MSYPPLFAESAFPYFSPYSSNSSSESLDPKVEENRGMDPTLYEASPRRHFAVPAVVVTAATPVAPLLPSVLPRKKKNTKIIKLKLPKQSIASRVAKPASHHRPSLRSQATMTNLVPIYDFYYPAQTLGNLPPDHLLDPRLFAPPKPATTYSEMVLPQLRELIANIKSTTDTHLMSHLPRLIDLVALLSQFPDFGLVGVNNLLAFRKHVESFFSTARTKEEDQAHVLLATKPEKDLKMVFRILDDLYTYNFPRRAACLIYPDDFEHKPGGETVSDELACLCPDQYEGDIDPSEPLLLYKQGWGTRASYVVTSSFAGDVGVQYPMYYY